MSLGVDAKIIGKHAVVCTIAELWQVTVGVGYTGSPLSLTGLSLDRGVPL